MLLTVNWTQCFVRVTICIMYIASSIMSTACGRK